MELYSFDSIFYVLRVVFSFAIGISLLSLIVAYRVKKEALRRARIKRAVQRRTNQL